MLKIYSELFNCLEKENVFYCSWKSNHLLSDFLNGIGDVDLYVDYIKKSSFEKIAIELGFIKSNSVVAQHKFVEHYFALDVDSGKIVHLHVYFKIVTGESNSKNYILPIENWIKENTVVRDIRVLSDDAQLVIFLLRYFIKIGSISSVLLLFRDKEKYKGEWGSLNKASLPKDVPIITYSFIQNLLNGYLSSNVILKLILSLKLKILLSGYTRRGFLEHISYKFFNTIKRLVNKLIFKRKKSLDTGVLVAICGLDGSGKSSAVKAIYDHFSNEFTVKEVHIGRPEPTLLTLPFWLVFRVLEKIKHGKLKKEKPIDCFIPKEKVSSVSAIRYTILAYERYKVSKKAFKYISNGYIVIVDRYPSLNYGKMDSPRVMKDDDRSILYRLCHQIESWCYRSILPCDLACHLSVPVEVAVERNKKRVKSGKETDNEIRARYIVNSDLTFNTNNYQLFDATVPMSDLHKRLIAKVWSVLG